MSSASIVEFFHALVMVVWVGSLPFLFWHRWQKLSIFLALYNLFFVIANRVSHYILGECVLTRIARSVGGDQSNEFFTVKFSRMVFGFIPSNKSVTYVEQTLVVIVSIGVYLTLRRKRLKKIERPTYVSGKNGT